MLHPLKLRILAIDDDPAIGELLRRIFEATGRFNVEVQTDPLLAVVAAEHFRPDLLFLDINMPGIDGVTLAKQLRLLPAFATRPFIFFTGLPIAGKKHEGDGHPLSIFVNKGTDSTRLIQIVDLMIERAGPAIGTPAG